MPQYLSTDPNAGASLPRPPVRLLPSHAPTPPRTPPPAAAQYLSTDPNDGEAIEEEEPKTLGGFVGNILPSAARFASGLASGVESFGKLAVTTSPPALLTRAAYAKLTGKTPQLTPEEEGVVRAGTDPVGTARAIGGAVKDRYGSLDAIGNTLYDDPVGAAADIATVAAPLLKVPAVARAARGLRVPAPLRNANAAERAAVEFGLREGIPVDAATATGNRAVKAVQHVSDRSLGGSLVAERAAQQQADALAQTGERLAARAHPAAAVSPEQAGQSVKDTLLTRVRGLNDEAEGAYGTLRGIEADPRHARDVPVSLRDTMVSEQGVEIADPALHHLGKPGKVPVTERVALPVDLRPVKEALDPLYQRLLRESELVPLQGEKGRALTALDRLMKAKDHAPLSVVDGALSDLKAMARTDIPELRSVGQGLAAEAVKQLDAVVQQTAVGAGDQAIQSLRLGRDAVRTKHVIGSTLKALSDEPVQVFNRATWVNDAGIENLRAIAQHAPETMGQIGRAYLDDLMSKATAEGGFKRADGLMQSWQRLGPETKQLLFKDQQYIDDLDNFFLLAKRTAETPNPSGTAHTLLTAGQGGWILADPITGIPAQIGTAALSKALHSPRVVRLLTEGMRVPLSNRAASAAVAAELSNTLGERWWIAPAVSAPAAASEEEPSEPVNVDAHPRVPARLREGAPVGTLPPLRGQSPQGQLEPGNIDLTRRPVVKNRDGTISTVRSMSVEIDGREVLIPTVSDDGRVLSDDDAIALFERTGRHLGVFDSPAAATAYAEQLHHSQARQYARTPPLRRP
jgi:hypothetical protein